MHCIRKITNDLVWVGANDRRMAMFEGVYSVPYGVSYNSYLLLDEKTVLFDTVDKAVTHRFLENVSEALKGRSLDYLVVQHMEPDHSFGIDELLRAHPDLVIVTNQKVLGMLEQFHDKDFSFKSKVVTEGDVLNTGRHQLTFLMAPMVHWPEVMITYDQTDKVLFSADAFGAFGALNGALFADEVDFERDYMDEARRYYANICGKYGVQVQSLLNKASALDIQIICPLHGFVWRKNLALFIDKYKLWSTYKPEVEGVMIAYASVYGNTENAAEILATMLRECGIQTMMYDVSVTPHSEIISECFKYSHLVFASTTYNMGIFVTMEALLHDLAAHNIQNRHIAFIENGSWAPTSGRLMREIMDKCKNMTMFENTVSVQSAVKDAQLDALRSLADAIAGSLNKTSHTQDIPQNAVATSEQNEISCLDANALRKLMYGLFVLSARDGAKDNACIVNTVMQVNAQPLTIAVSVNKDSYTHEMIHNTGLFNVSVLSESATFDIFQRFGFVSGKAVNKFKDEPNPPRAANGIVYLKDATTAMIGAKVIEGFDCGSHTMFYAQVTESLVLSDIPSATYAYYFEKIKPAVVQVQQHGYVCKICGYVYDGDHLPPDYICPICKHGACDFEMMHKL